MADDKQAHPLDGFEGKAIKITPKDGSAPYEGIVRSVHETGLTIWMDEKLKEEGEIRTVHLFDVKYGTAADATYELL